MGIPYIFLTTHNGTTSPKSINVPTIPNKPITPYSNPINIPPRPLYAYRH